MTDLADERLVRLVEGELDAAEAEDLEAQAARDPRVRARIDELRALRSMLGTDAELDDVDLLPSVRAALAAPARLWPRRRLFAWTAPPAMLLAAAVALVVVQRRGDEEGYRAKGASGAASNTGLGVFHQTAQGLVPVAGPIAPDAALAFSYTNGGAEPFSHLMVFAVDVARRVYWYWPGYSDEQADPSKLVAVAATRGRDVELAEVVRHAMPRGPMTLYAVFLRRAATIAEVERAIDRGDEPPFGLGAEVAWQAVPIAVTP